MRPPVIVVLGLSLAGFPTAHAADLATGLVGYWKLDDASSLTAVDSSPSQANGAYVNAPMASTVIPPLITYADPGSTLFSKASTQAVHMINPPAALRPAAVTLAAWFKLRTALSGTGVAMGQADVVTIGDQALLRVYSSMVGTAKRITGLTWISFNVAANPNDLAWHHLAATVEPARLAVYYDGALAGTMPDPTSQPILYDLSPDVWIARHGSGTGRDFDGNIDEVAIWSRALTAAEIAALASGSQAPGTNIAAQPPDAGADAPVDAGAPPVDMGAPRVDTGAPPVDTGAPPVDTGAPRVDTGGTAADAAAPEDTGGAPPPDAAPVTDAGNADRPRTEGSRPPPPTASGCGCASSPSPVPVLVLVLVAVLVPARRARRS